MNTPFKSKYIRRHSNLIMLWRRQRYLNQSPQRGVYSIQHVRSFVRKNFAIHISFYNVFKFSWLLNWFFNKNLSQKFMMTSPHEGLKIKGWDWIDLNLDGDFLNEKLRPGVFPVKTFVIGIINVILVFLKQFSLKKYLDYHGLSLNFSKDFGMSSRHSACWRCFS
jgi:hypothetical protein